MVDWRGIQREASCVSSIIGQGKFINVEVWVSLTSERRFVFRTDRSAKQVLLDGF